MRICGVNFLALLAMRGAPAQAFCEPPYLGKATLRSMRDAIEGPFNSVVCSSLADTDRGAPFTTARIIDIGVSKSKISDDNELKETTLTFSLRGLLAAALILKQINFDGSVAHEIESFLHVHNADYGHLLNPSIEIGYDFVKSKPILKGHISDSILIPNVKFGVDMTRKKIELAYNTVKVSLDLKALDKTTISIKNRGFVEAFETKMPVFFYAIFLSNFVEQQIKKVETF